MDELKQKVAVGVITELTKDSIKVAFNAVKKYYKDLSEKEAIDFGNSYEKYLEIASNKVSMVKTILFRKVPVDLYTIYECINLRCNGNEIESKDVNNILASGHKIIITGTAGIGKTTMLRHLFLNTIRTSALIPVFVELRGVNAEDKDISIFELIYNSLSNCGFNVEKDYFKYSLESGKYVIFYDGFDEIKTEKSLLVAKGIRELSTKYPDNYYIMTSRPLDQFIGWNDFVEMHAMDLNKKQALSLVKRLDYDKVTKDKFYQELENGLFEKYHSFASNPLLLNIMLLTFDERASIPDKLNDFYEQAFAALFNVHDGSKDCFKRDIRTGLGCDDFKQIFSYFCFKTYFNSTYEFTENSVREYLGKAKKKFPNIEFSVDDFLEDLIKSVCVLVKDGLIYTFSHRSFQEYFAACYTTKLVDADQIRLIDGWLSENKGFGQDPYFVMLFNMQGDKFNKIILCRGLEKIKKLYENGFTLDLLKKMFSKVTVRKVLNGDTTRYKVYLSIKDNYLCAILRMTCLFNNFHFKEINNCEEFMQYATEKRTLTDIKEIPFEVIERDGMVNQALKQLAWVDEQIQFGFSILDLYAKRKIGNKRKVSSIIDSL